MSPRMSTREKVLYEAGFKHFTRAASTLLTQMLMVDVYGEDQHATCGRWEVTGDELMAKAREVGGGIAVRDFIEKYTPACMPKASDPPLGLGTAPVLMVGWLHGRKHPALFLKFCHGIQAQRCDLTTFLRRHVDPTKKRARSRLTPQEIYDEVLHAWTQYAERVGS